MIKRVFGISILGLLIAFGCSREAMREQADASSPATNAAPVNLSGTVAQAKAENKTVLLDFTGSDWCPPCMELHAKVFSQPEFQSYAQSNLAFVTVDFPKKFHLPPDASATNDLLAAQFNIEGFPTLIALDGSGKEIWRHLGYIDGGFKELQSSLETAKSKAK
jgi:thiol-disulfide isomerase/thioredoxin